MPQDADPTALLRWIRAYSGSLRQDPDVIMVGELRDLESVSLALSAAETGHLVLATLHTNGAAESIERMVGISPPEQQQVRFQLSIGIAGVVYQTLLPRTGGMGRVAAYEVLVGTNALKNLIRQNQISQIRSYMFMGEQYGMQTLEQALVYLVKERQVSTEEALARAQDRATLEKLMEANGIRVPAELRSAPGQGARTRTAS